MTIADVPPDVTGDAPPPSGPRRRTLPRWARRLAIAAVLALAVWVLIVSSKRTQVGIPQKDPDPVIVAQMPPPNGRALRQTVVGAQLRDGYDGRLTVNGIAIPEEEMDGAIDPTSVSAQELERFGIRPNRRYDVFFTPGPGKVIESFDTGPVSITLRYFRDRQNTATGRTISWTVNVS